ALAGLGEACGEGAVLPAEMAGGLGLAPALQAAEHERRAMLLRQRRHLLVEDGLHLAQRRLDFRCGARDRRGALLAGAAAGVPALHLQGRAVSGPVEPACQGAGVADGGGLAGEDEEGSLEGVLRVVGIAEYTAANAQDEPPVPPNQGSEG